MDNYVGNQRFIVCFGTSKLSFAKVSNLQTSIEYDTIQIGGINDSVYITPAPAKQTQTILFERGTKVTDIFSKKMRPGMWLGKRVEIMICATVGPLDGMIIRKYHLDDGLITRWEMTPLDAMGNEILIQKFEIAHTGLYQDL